MRNITVKIISETVQDSPSADNGADDNKAPSPEADDKKKISAVNSFASQITKTITSEIVSDANYYMGRYYSMAEDYKGQQNNANTMKIINMTTGLASTSFRFGKLGAAFGPIGAVIGATIGVGVSLARNYMSATKEYNNAMLAIQENAYSNYFYSERAGYIDGSRGTND